MSNIVIGIILLIAAVFLTVVILMQEGKNSKLSGAIAGGSDNFLGKNKKGGNSARLSMITSIVAVCFVVVVLVLYILQPNNSKLDPDKINPADPDAVTSGEVADDEKDEKDEKDEAKESEASGEADDAEGGEADDGETDAE